MQCVISHNNWRKLQWCKWVWLSCSVLRGPRITRTTYNAVSVHGSRRPRYNGAAVYLKIVTSGVLTRFSFDLTPSNPVSNLT